MIRISFYGCKEYGIKHLLETMSKKGSTKSERAAILIFLWKNSMKDWVVQRSDKDEAKIEILLDNDKYTLGKRGKIVKVGN